ncbi:MAG TPA: hypothetical protein VGF06_08865 [Terriglobales bacterium]|jgi:tetratricopeptide (TPR) repeat protein
MSSSRRITITATLLLAISFAGAVITQNRLDRLRSGASLQEVLYITSPNALKRLSLGYNGLLADIYWTRAVQYFGHKHQARSSQYALLAPLLDITTSLDPHLVVAYEFGANFLSAKPPDGAGAPEKAVQLMQKGIEANPNEWRLYYNLGFIYYWELKDYKNAAISFERGSQRPDAHPFLKVLAANMAQHAGDTQMARLLWTTTFQSAQDRQVKVNAVAHLRALQVDDEVAALEELVQQYKHRTGRMPAGFADMIREGLLPGIPIDPARKPYKLMPDGRVEVRNPDDIPFITKGTPPGYKPPPPVLDNVKPEIPN